MVTTMKGILVCKTCLITNVKMFHLLDTLANAYSQLTGSECDGVTREYVCYECAALLLKYQQFRTKCLRANKVISEFVGKYCKITENIINTIDRKLHNLESTINKFEIKENTFNEFYNESKFDGHGNDGPEQSIVIEIDDVIVPSEIKNEVNLNDDKDQTVSNDNESLYEEYLEDDIDVVIVASEIKDQVELYDDKNVSDENGSLHLEDDVSLDKDCFLKLDDDCKDDVRKKAVGERIEIKKKKGPQRNNLEHESVEEREPSIKLQKKSRKKIRKSELASGELEECVTVVNLTPEEAKKEILLRKESDNYQKNPYKCDLCYRGYGVLNTYENHMKKHNKEMGEYKCDCCHIRFSKVGNLTKHRYANHTMKVYCKVCPYICFNQTQAKAHINLHKGKKYPCQECDQVFNMPNTLRAHQHHKHLSCEFVCALCGTIFGKERGLSLHISLLHKQEANDQKGPLCEECDIHFATEAAWKRHLVLSSKHTVSNGCEVCGETYESEEALKRHARVHTRTIIQMTKHKYYPLNKKPIDCNICKKTLIGRVKYIEHMRTDHPTVAPKTIDYDYVQCEICGKMCRYHSFYMYHQKIHRSERPYPCLECGKSFKTRTILKIHLASHSSVHLYKCPQCPKTFAFQSSHSKHLKAHLGIRPHKCNICDKSFPTPCEVKYHTQYVHQKLPWPKRDRSKRKKSARVVS